VAELDARSSLATALKATYARIVSPSEDTTGAADLANLQAALDDGGTVQLVAGADYYFNGALALPSNSALTAYGATLHGLAVGNLFRTKTALPARSVTDAGATSGSTTLTSATAAFTAADVGAKVSVRGAGPHQSTNDGQSWYGTITAVTNATTVTIDKAAGTTITGAQLEIFPDRVHDVAVLGGTWSIEAEPADGHASTGNYFNALCSAFRRVDRLILRDLSISVVGTSAEGGKFAISIADATNITVDNIVFTGTPVTACT